MLALLALTLAAGFFILLRMGILDELPNILGRRRAAPSRRVRSALGKRQEVEEAKRLEVFRDFLEGDAESEE